MRRAYTGAGLFVFTLDVVHGSGLRDNPIAGDAIRYLDGRWLASTPGLSIPATVPGDLVSDLHAADMIGNPLYELNWLNSSLWDDNVWTYSTSFEAMPNAVLVFDGVKMGAEVKVNGLTLGTMTDQFLRYTFPLESLKETNSLEVSFDKKIVCDGRWMACSGGWDWAPYSDTKQEDTRTFTKGIWKSVYIVSIGAAAIEHFVPHVFFKGGYPVNMLVDGDHSGFEVRSRVHFYASKQGTSGTLSIGTEWGASLSQRIELPSGRSSVAIKLEASASQVKLWWPSGMGAQPLYRISATFTPDVSGEIVSTERRIGFRFVALVTGNDTDDAYRQKAVDEEGSDAHGMYFRVNGAIIFSRGANMIPMEEIEGWMDAGAHAELVKSAAAANFNTLRVWGGGMFLPDVWYDTCDELGLLVYHDMQYAGQNPRATPTQDSELRHQVRRLSHHASIVIWDGCNECQVKMGTDTGIYATFVMTVVAQEDKSRVVWPSCPALGWTTGVHKLTQFPNGNNLTTPDYGGLIEVHGPYQHGTGFPAVNNHGGVLQLFDSDIPLKLQETKTGPALQNLFTSEFGGAVMSSFESMSPTLDPKHWSLHAGQPSDTCEDGPTVQCKGANVMAQRNYPCDNFVEVFFGKSGASHFNSSGEFTFKKQLYQCMLGHALHIKGKIEGLRASNSFGVIVWQYNEIWPTGGWGSIEYGNPKFDGQVIGGRWKPLHYWYKSSIFQDVMATCGQNGVCYVKNDSPFPFTGTLVLNSTHFQTGIVTTLYKVNVVLPAGPGTTKWVQSEAVQNLDGVGEILQAVVIDGSGTVVSQNTIPFATPEKMILKKAVLSVEATKDCGGHYTALVKSDAVAVYVTLTTLAHGIFEDNAFLLLPPGRAVKFMPSALSPHSNETAFERFQKSLRVEDVSVYKGEGPTPSAQYV
ncbi:unnamed protein product [Prorocentrum cordatum]|uniref:beta-mannosidase n=1 Tax=Prorocentrum cordatum TaxID=2364126 RepID=A0ABN9RMQ1_9DINO|nr:unnamed protein product [Polarella glacialis]